ncbi:phenylacetate--CoA ligase family protein [Methylocapsa sp. S129]|uniref:phenylacetate--CoA ligase family protein n=1 Tax=Methylocapsa sp. S129 TaxID=1641869 RepID=UPI00131AC319|nr:AMP-binding protein [Methylocapsa sp. S129]
MNHRDAPERNKSDAAHADAFARLRALLSGAAQRAPALARQLEGVEIASLKSLVDLARVPVRRKSELMELQEAIPPFGGLAATEPAHLKRLLVSPGPIFEPEGHGADWWGVAPALRAAGFRAGDIVLNCFSYHLTPGGHIMESGAHALGCAVIPAGTGNTEQQIEAIRHLRPSAYCGTPDFLKILIDKAHETGSDISSIRHAMVSGAALPASLRAELQSHGIKVRQAYATADLGMIAYEAEGEDGLLQEGLVVNEGIILEIVTPGTGDPVAPGKVGEIVVTRLNADYPLLRFATGDLSAFVPDSANGRIKGWLGRADQTAKVKGMFVHPSQIAEVGKRHPELGILRLVIRRTGEQDVMILRAETASQRAELSEAVAVTLQAATKLRGAVELVAPGSLPNDGRVIADERPVG